MRTGFRTFQDGMIIKFDNGIALDFRAGVVHTVTKIVYANGDQ